MKANLLRLVLILPVVALVFGCASTGGHVSSASAAPANSRVTSLGVVGTSGYGNAPSEPGLRMTLRNEAARQFGVPVEEIVLGDLEIDESRSLGWEAGELNTNGNDHRMVDGGKWSARAEASRKTPKQS